MFDLTAFLQMIGPATDVAKGLASLDEKQRLLDVLIQARLLVGENAELRAKVDDLESKLRFGEMLRFERNVYWSADPKDPGPFCPACWDSKKTAVHLIDRNTASPNHFKCEVCDKYFDASGQRDQPRSQRSNSAPW